MVDLPEYVPVAEAARRLGCSRDTVYAGIRAGTIPALKLTPNCIRIPRVAFERYIRGDEPAGLRLLHTRKSA